MTDGDVKELSKEVFRLELKASEKVEELVREHSVDEINDAMGEVIEEVLENVEDNERRGKVFLLTHQIGQAVNSEEMAKKGKQYYEEWAQG